MKTPRRLLSVLALATGLWLAAARTGVAKDSSFPEKSPLVSFTLPDAWRSEQGMSEKGGLPYFISSPGDYIIFAMSVLGESYDEAAFKQKLPDIAKAWITANQHSAPENLQFGKLNTHPLGKESKIPTVYCEASFTTDKKPCQMLAVGFSVGGKSMLILCIAPKDADDKTAPFDTILNSFKSPK